MAQEILAYLADHPEATDTLEGIVTWWLLERRIKHVSELVQETLKQLVKEGLVFESTRESSVPVYGLKVKLQSSRKETGCMRYQRREHSASKTRKGIKSLPAFSNTE